MPNRGINFSPIFSPHLVTNPQFHELSNMNSELKQFWTLPFAYFFVQFNALFSAFFVCISCFSCSAWKKFHQITYLFDSFLSKYFPIWLLRPFFNELKINSNSSSLMPSLLFVFEVKVDYVEGNSRMIIYNNYVEMPQLYAALIWTRPSKMEVSP